jgi:DNA-binding transcriptional regulator PaaX
MITIEKDTKAEEIFIHAVPEDLRGFAKKLWQMSEKADAKGRHKEQFTTKLDSDIELSTRPLAKGSQRSVVKKLTIFSSQT